MTKLVDNQPITLLGIGTGFLVKIFKKLEKIVTTNDWLVQQPISQL